MNERTYDLSKNEPTEGYVFCPHCATKNPRKAYCCLKCFKVMFPSSNALDYLRLRVPTSISVTVIFSALVFSALYLANKWLTNVEANMTLHIKTTSYNLAVTADKKKNESATEDVSLEK